MQVCSTWLAVSRWDALWQRLTRRIWGRTHLLHLHATWRDEFIYWHRTAQNFRSGRSTHATLHFDDVDDPDGHTCRCLTLSDSHLACGFADGAVRLFELSTRNHLRTFHPHPANRLGHFSRAVSGIVFSNNNTTLVFATLDGDIHVAIINGPALADTAHVGSLVDDGTLVDFTGCGRWWVGLHAGAPGRAFHIWDSVTQLPIFVGGSLTDPEAVMGWHMLTEVTEFVGRIRVTSQESAVACTSSRVMVIDLSNPGVVLFDEEARRGLIVTSADVSDDAYISVDGRGRARVRRVDTMEDVCRFNVFGGGGGGGGGGSRVMGCMNRGYALMCVGGVIRVWEVEHGVCLYPFGERIGEVNALVANETHVAAASSDNTIHLWDFGAGAGAGAGAE